MIDFFYELFVHYVIEALQAMSNANYISMLFPLMVKNTSIHASKFN